MRHQWLIQRLRAHLQHEIGRCANSLDLGEAKFRDLAGFERGEGRTAHAGGSGKLFESESLCAPALRDQLADRREIH